MYQVILSINNNEEVAVLPAVPTDLGPQLPQNNGTYEGPFRGLQHPGAYGPLGDVHCQLLPRRPALQLHAGRRLDRRVEVCGLLRAEPPRMLPFRIIILDGNGVCRMNSPCSVDQFSGMSSGTGISLTA